MTDDEQAAAFGRAAAERADRTKPSGWVCPAPSLDDELDADDAEAAFYDAMGAPRTLEESLAAFTGASSGIAHDWTDGLNFGGAEPADTLGVWAWDESRLLVGDGRDDAAIVRRGEWFAERLAGDAQRRGVEGFWGEVLAAADRGELPPEHLPDVAALLAPTAERAAELGWTGRYPAALRAAAIRAGAVSDHGKPSRGAIWAAVCAGEGGWTDRQVGYWLSGQKPLPWAVWAALRGISAPG